MFHLFRASPEAGKVREPLRGVRIQGLVRVQETGEGAADLIVGVELWNAEAARRVVLSTNDPAAFRPHDAPSRVVRVLTDAKGWFALEAAGDIATGEVLLLTVRAPVRGGDGAGTSPLHATPAALSPGGDAIVIELSAARLATAGARLGKRRIARPAGLDSLLHAIAAMAPEVGPKRPSYSQRYLAAREADRPQAAARLATPPRRGPSLRAPNAAGDTGAESIAIALARLVAPAGLQVRVDPTTGDATVSAPPLPLTLRRPDTTPDPFAMRRLRARWAAAAAAAPAGRDDPHD